MKNSPTQTVVEEIGNASIHGLGILLSIAALAVLVSFSAAQGDPWKVVSTSLFASSSILMYTASTLYHSSSEVRIKALLKRIDHISIYLLIASSYTPFALVTLRHSWGWWLFGIVWGCALMGTIFKLFFTHRFQVLSLSFYLIMGWFSILAVKPIYEALSMGGFLWLLAGGLCYTVGAVFYAWKRLPFSHVIWHAFVLAGSACHFVCIFFYVVLV